MVSTPVILASAQGRHGVGSTGKLAKKRLRRQQLLSTKPKPWYRRTATKIGTVAVTICVGVSVGVLTSALSGPTQRALGTSSNATGTNAAPVASPTGKPSPTPSVPLIAVKATKLGGQNS